MTEFTQDAKLDASLVHAAMHGLFNHFAMLAGLKPDEALARANWLKEQPNEYIQEVADLVNKAHEHEDANG